MDLCCTNQSLFCRSNGEATWQNASPSVCQPTLLLSRAQAFNVALPPATIKSVSMVLFIIIVIELYALSSHTTCRLICLLDIVSQSSLVAHVCASDRNLKHSLLTVRHFILTNCVGLTVTSRRVVRLTCTSWRLEKLFCRHACAKGHVDQQELF